MGSAAFNIGGVTCHSGFKINVRNPSKPVQGTDVEQVLLERFEQIIALIIDERSMLSTDVVDTIERNLRTCIYNGHMKQEQFGAIPIILLFGDDHQLPSIVSDRIGYGAEFIFDSNMNASHLLNINQLNGRQCLLDLAKKVVILTNIRRLDSDGQDLREICDNIRDHGGVTTSQDTQLKELHLNYGKVSSDRKEYLKKHAMWIYTTVAEVDEHNYNEMKKLVNKENPIIRLPSKIYGRFGNPAVKSHFDSNILSQSHPVLCRQCRVTLDRNYCTSIGLFNGSTGTVQEIRYNKGTSPLRSDFPAYVLIDSDTYDGVPWNNSYPTFVPLFPMKTFCKKSCCILEYIPISLAFAKTVHKVQGKEFGPRFKNLPALVANIGKRMIESLFLGITYVVLSRVSTIGNGDPNKSALYFSGPPFEPNRFTDLIHKKDSIELYKRYEDRQRWISHITKVADKTDVNMSMEEKKLLKQWMNES